MEITRIFDTFRTAFLANAGDTIADLYDTPFVYFRARQNVVQPERAGFIADANAIREAYARLGLADMKYTILSEERFEAGLIIASVEWRYMTAQGDEIVRHECTCGLRPHGDHLRFAFHVSHNEYARRPAFVSSAGTVGPETHI